MSAERNVQAQAPALSRAERFGLLRATGATVWLTGLSGSGKSTIAGALERDLLSRGVRAFRLDGDTLRTGINKDLGFAPEHRTENIRRIGEIARLFAESGAIAIVGAISPFRADRDAARALHEQHPEGPLAFLEVFLDTPLAVCEQRDPKGLYRKARAGELKGFTGIDAAYERADEAELALHTERSSVPECVRAVLDLLRSRGVLTGSP